MRTMTDGLGRAEIELPDEELVFERAIVTVGSEGFEPWVDDLFGSIRANGDCPDAKLVVFFFGDATKMRRIAQMYDALIVQCRALAPLGPSTKSVVYAAGDVLSIGTMICLDADTLVLGPLSELFAIAEADPSGVQVSKDAWGSTDLTEAVQKIYLGEASDIELLVGEKDAERVGKYPLAVNDGVFAVNGFMLPVIHSVIKDLAGAQDWMSQKCPWRNQFIFNLAIALLDVGRDMDTRFNTQLCFQELDEGEGVRCGGEPVVVLHFNGSGRNKHPELRGKYRCNMNRYLSLSELASVHQSDKGQDFGEQHGYTEVYESFFRELKEKPINIMEIGLRFDPYYENGSEPGSPSLRMWLDYFPNAKVFGLDINDFSVLSDERTTIYQGDQGDPLFLSELTSQMPEMDIIIDDGSHASYHQQLTLSFLFHRLKHEGLYVIEDLHFQPPDPPDWPKVPTTRDWLASPAALLLGGVTVHISGKLGVIRKLGPTHASQGNPKAAAAQLYLPRV